MNDELIYISDEEIESKNYMIKGSKLIVNGVEYKIISAEPRGYKVLKL